MGSSYVNLLFALLENCIYVVSRYHFLVTSGSVMAKFFLFPTSLEVKTLMVMMLQQRQLKSR